MARLPRAILHRDDALQLAIEQNPGARGYLLTQMWMEITGVHLILSGDYPRFLAIEEDEPVASGGRHEYGLRTLRCDRHVLNDGRRVHVRGGCGRIGAVTLERLDKQAKRIRHLGLAVLGLNLRMLYLDPYDPADGERFPFCEFETSEPWTKWEAARRLITGISADELKEAIALRDEHGGNAGEWTRRVWLG